MLKTQHSHTNYAVGPSRVRSRASYSGFPEQVRQIWRGPVSTAPHVQTGLHQRIGESRAHETANMRVHRRCHAKCTDRRRTGRASRARAPASMPTNSMASLLHRPPVSSATTTKRHRLPATSSAYLVSLSRRARMGCSIRVCSVGLWPTIGGSGAAEGDVHR